MDSNQDGFINPFEALDVFLMMRDNREDIHLDDISKLTAKLKNERNQEALDLLKDVDKNGNDIIEFSEVDEKVLSFLKYMDKDSSGSVTKQEAFDYMKADNTPVSFNIQNNIVFMTGVITASTPAKVLELIFEHPNVKTIEMINVPGSIDDVSNLRASLYIHQFGLSTRLNERSIIASDGTDFFLAGKEREVAKGAKIGVHSWSGGAKPATELPKNHIAHKKYIDYYKIVNIPTEFYWYTLEAAPAYDIHFMREEEIKKYKVRTK